MTRSGSGDGAAYDASVLVLQDRLANLGPDAGERERIAKRAEVHRELYELQHKVSGTREHAAHRDALVRLMNAAAAGLASAETAVERAQDALAGAREAHDHALDNLSATQDALAAFDRDHGTEG